ncbi:MAG TPA: ATP-binding cassette domain-containing protein [Gammaproteobacteria bacterium]|nr:ATP-binding cassette domain-containing protein [Gammaproteobacteria bacterium]
MSFAPLVELERVDVDLAGSPVLSDVSWRLARGERWGVVGANGSGKTTFLGLIAGTVWPAPGRGERRYDFGSGPAADAVQARAEIATASHELQDRYARWGWNFTALDVVLSGVYRTDVPRREPDAPERSGALATMRELGIAHLAPRRFLELSRGEQRRVLIARGIAFDPTVLLLDEPASGLDRAARIELASLLERIPPRIALVCTAHAEEDLPTSIDRIVRLERGRIVSVLERRPHGTAEPAPSAARSSATAAPKATGDGGAGPAAQLPLAEVARANVWLGARHVLHDVSWRIDAGQHWIVSGANGSGKSTLLRLLHGQVRPAAGGAIRWPALGDPRNVWTLRRRVAWVSPELQAAYRYPSSVRACIASGFDSSVGLTRAPTDDESTRVTELLREFALDDLAERPLSSLSYGQTRRALIARALVNRPRLLLLDEPWEGLDEAISATLNAALAAAIAHGTQLVCATHLAAHREAFTHELELDAGRIARAGPVGAAPR